MSAKNVFSFRSETTILSMRPCRSAMTFLSKSCVIGRGVETFSICSAIAFASKTPTQIGRTRWPSLSRRMMMGMLVMGSTISPLIVISICMFPAQAVRVCPGDLHLDDLSDPRRVAGKIDDCVARRASRQLPLAPAARGVDQHGLDATDGSLEQLALDRPL